jgi:hypothetical protein
MAVEQILREGEVRQRPAPTVKDRWSRNLKQADGNGVSGVSGT